MFDVYHGVFDRCGSDFKGLIDDIAFNEDSCSSTICSIDGGTVASVEVEVWKIEV